MDWKKAELLHPQHLVNIERVFPSAGTDDPTWDLDNDLLFSDNGVKITFVQPITGYQWIEVTLVNIDVPASVNPRISCQVFPESGSVAVGAATTGNVPVAAFSEFVMKIPVVQQVEQIAFFPVFPFGGKRVGIKSIKVLVKDDKFELAKDATRVVMNMPGFVYDPVAQVWTASIISGDQSFGNFSVTGLVDGLEFAVLRVQTTNNSPSPLVIMPWDNNQSYSGESGFIEFSIGGNSLVNPFPKSLNIFNVDGFQTSKVQLEIFIGRWNVNVSAFGGIPQPSGQPAVAFNPYAINFLNQNNVWAGVNTYNGVSLFNGSVQFLGTIFTPLIGYLKGVAGIIVAAATIPNTDITGLGTISTQNANAVAITGGNINGTPIGLSVAAQINGTVVTSVGGSFLGNTIGFYSSVNRGSSIWSNYAAGTADNYYGGCVGIGDPTPFANNNILSISIIHPTAGNFGTGVGLTLSGPSSLATSLTGYSSFLVSATAAYTLSEIVHYRVASTTKGAGSTITNNYGFYVASSFAVASNNYGFYANFANAANTYQFYANGSAPSFFGGNVGIIQTPVPTFYVLYVGASATLTSANPAGIYFNGQFPATSVGTAGGFISTVGSAAAAFVIGQLNSYAVAEGVKGAGSTITSQMGYYCSDLVNGANNYGFYSAITTGATKWQLYMAGNALSFFAGAVGIIQNQPLTSDFALLSIGSGAASHQSGNTTIRAVSIDYQVPVTATVQATGFRTSIRTINSAFTAALISHYLADTTIKGAASTITGIRGFYASNSIVATATAVAGFYSDINTASGVTQLNMAGTADSRFAGALTMSSAALIPSAAALTYSASMTINAALGNSFTASVTDAVAHTFNAPTNPRAGQRFILKIRNTTAGAIGAATFNAAFKMTAWTQPLAGFSRTVEFEYDGSNWIEVDRTAVDIPN